MMVEAEDPVGRRERGVDGKRCRRQKASVGLVHFFADGRGIRQN